MAIPALPSVTSIVTQALKRSGRVNPTTDQITEATDHALQEVKADIMLVAPTHPNLKTSATTYTTKGQQRYAIPSDSDEQISIILLDGPDDWRGTAMGGGAQSITLASTLSVAADDLIGKYIIITGGPGNEEYREILDYDTSTHIASVDADWGSMPVAGSTYLIVTQTLSLWPIDTRTDMDKILTPTSLGRPERASTFDQEFLLYPTPDKIYGLMNRYWADLSLLDETGDLFTQLLREWRSLWIQGIAVKSMQRFDEDRYQLELSVYTAMLTALERETCQVSQVQYRDV